MICPKCGASLPETAELCWSCRKTFVPNVKLPEDNIQPTYRMTIQQEDIHEEKTELAETTHESITVKQSTVSEEKYVPPNHTERLKAMDLYCHLGLLGLVLLIVSVSNKYYYTTLAKNISDYQYTNNGNILFIGVQIAVAAAFLILVFLNDTDRYITKDDATGKILISLLGLVYAYFFTTYCKKIYFSSGDWNKNTYGALQLLLYGGYICNLISGLMTYSVAYTLDEKSKLTRKK